MNDIQRKELEKMIEESYEDILSTEKVQKEAAQLLKSFVQQYILSSGKDLEIYKEIKILSGLYEKSVLDLNTFKKDVVKAIDEIETLDLAKNEDIKTFKENEMKRQEKIKPKRRSIFNNSGRAVIDKIKSLKKQEKEIAEKEKELKLNEHKLMSVSEKENYNIEVENLNYMKLSYEAEMKDLKERSEIKNKELRAKMIAVFIFLGIIFYFIIN